MFLLLEYTSFILKKALQTFTDSHTAAASTHTQMHTCLHTCPYTPIPTHNASLYTLHYAYLQAPMLAHIQALIYTHIRLHPHAYVCPLASAPTPSMYMHMPVPTPTYTHLRIPTVLHAPYASMHMPALTHCTLTQAHI